MNPDKTVYKMCNKTDKGFKYKMQRYIGHWFLISGDEIKDHNQYRNDLISKYNLEYDE